MARILMNYLEKVTIDHNGWFVDLFVRPSNSIAIKMYRNLGYEVFRTVDKYYGAGEDAYGMSIGYCRHEKVNAKRRDKIDIKTD